MKPGSNCCDCLAFSTSFDFDDPTFLNGPAVEGFDWLPNLAADSHYGWFVSGTGQPPHVKCWNKFGNHYPYRAICNTAPPRHLMASFDFIGTTPNQKLAMVYVADDGTTAKRYMAEVELSDQEQTDTDLSHCGTLRLWNADDLTSLVPLVFDVFSIPGLAYASNIRSDAGHLDFHTLKICYDPETRVFSVAVTAWNIHTQTGKTYWAHAKECTTPADTLANSAVWMAVTDFNGGPGDSSVEAAFANFRIHQTKNLSNDITGVEDDDFGDSELEKCPCCKPAGCEVQSDDFEDGVLDCRWSAITGTFTETGGQIVASAPAAMRWRGSWSGLNDDCLPDCSVRVAVTGTTPSSGGDNTWAVSVDQQDSTHYHWARLESNSGTGTLKLYRTDGGTPVELASVDLESHAGDEPFTLTVCMLYNTLTANLILNGVNYQVSSGEGDYSEGSTTAFCGPFVELAVLSSSGGKFDSFEVLHNLAAVNCPDCLGDDSGDGGGGGGIVIDGSCDLCTSWSKYVLIKVRGAIDAGTDQCDSDICSHAFDSFICPWSGEECSQRWGAATTLGDCRGCAVTVGVGAHLYRDVDGHVKMSGTLTITAVSGIGFCTRAVSFAFGPLDLGTDISSNCTGFNYLLAETARDSTGDDGAALTCAFLSDLTMTVSSF